MSAHHIRSIRAAAVALTVAVAACGTTTPKGPPATAATTGEWQRLNPFAVPVPGGAEDVLAVDGGFLIAGFNRKGAFLHWSPDGVQWLDRSSGIEDNGAGVGITALAPGADTTVALLDVSTPDGPVMAFRRTTNGSDWRTVDVPVANEFTRVIAADVVWTGSEFVAIGGRPSGGDDPTVQAVIATSNDGLQWSIDAPPALNLNFARGPDAATVWQQAPIILATSPGGTNATLLRRDGRGSWSATAMQEVRDDLVMSIASAQDGLVLGGCKGGLGAAQRPTVWIDTDADARNLTPVRLPGEGCVLSVAEGDSQWVATGTEGGQAAVWSSSDMTTWELGMPKEVFRGSSGAVARGAAYSGGTWLAVGRDLRTPTSDPPETVAVWRRP